MADLLEDVHKSPPRGNPFGPGFVARFNWLKFFALLGVHGLFALRLNPGRLAKIAPRFAEYAGRIYGYIEKAHVPGPKARQLRKKIRPFVFLNKK